QRLGGFGWTLPAELSAACLRMRFLGMLTLLLLVLQLALGGWTSANYAALACPDFPLCQEQLLPEVNFAQGFNFTQQIGPNYLGGMLDNQGRTAIHLTHRIGALIVSLTIILMAIRLWGLGCRQARNLSLSLVGLLALQIALGVSNIVFGLPLAVAVAHNAVGALLLLTVVMVNHRLRTVKTQ
ncbi:MAG: COX15/CtaA family protein, partial [Cellvibrionaceae bacterium]|nr:COX15/CtaA family protein [Cellvibrionaceae bacterium]